jgi:hypothetical protein
MHWHSSFLLPLLLSVTAFLCSCVAEKIKPEDANVDLLVAVEYKRLECGSVPPLPIFVIDELEKNALAGCVIAIFSAPCPVTEYPPVCLRMYGKNIPGAVELQDALVPR